MKIFMLTWAFIYAVFGLSLYFIPELFMSSFGVAIDTEGGMLMAEVLGSALTSFAVMMLINFNKPLTDKTQRNALIANFVYVVIDTPVACKALIDGVMNNVGWVPVGVHIYLGLTMGYFLFIKKK